MQHLSDLNPNQLEAVRHGDGPLLIFAGAGSGKTRVLTRRIANLILEHSAEPDEILAVTFTNKAAQEMKERAQALFERRFLSPWISTFHAGCARILRQHAPLLDYTSNFAIYDSGDTLSLLKRVYKRMQIDSRLLEPKMVRAQIDRAKNEYQFPEDIRKSGRFPQSIAELVADVYVNYQRELRAANAMDFGDLLCNTITLFKLEPAILEQYREQFRYVLIDEYQDTNHVQYLLVKLLTEQHKNICVVGDDDQSIYGFRGANIRNILDFKHDFPDAKVITLNKNYRSTKRILDTANSVIRRNKARQPKQMITDNQTGAAVVSYHGYNEKDEAEFVVREIAVLKEKGKHLSQMAVFYRTNAQSRAIEEALHTAGIRYEIFGGHKFYDRKEIKDILAYARLILNRQDSESFMRIINTPPRGIGSTSLGSLVAYADKNRLALLPALENAVANKAPFVTGKAGAGFSKFLGIMRSLNDELHSSESMLSDVSQDFSSRSIALAEFLKQTATVSDYLSRLQAEDTVEAESRIENLYELFRVAQEFAGRAIAEEQIPSLAQFLERASLASDLDNDNTATLAQKQDYISLMTLHLAKGLEFDVVFLMGLEEGLLPHVHSMDDKSAIEEERRLCYVGITRAKQQLYLTRARIRQTYGRSNWYSGEPSRFLYDIPSNLLEERSAWNP